MSDEPLLPLVTVFVHPRDTTRFPREPAGSWRWAVHLGNHPPTDLNYCVNAGLQPDKQSAGLIGEAVGSAIFKALHVYGVFAEWRTIHLGHDPVPTGDDRVSFA